MMIKRILGLDLGTNSIGWALIEIDHERGSVKIVGLGSRILPMDAGEIGDFESKGIIKSKAAQRTEYRGARRLNERFVLRRDRLHLILNLLNALPDHYKIEIDFERNGEKCGQFKVNSEPKITYKSSSEDPSKYEFIYENAYNEMILDLQKAAPLVKNEKGYRVPRDWTLYYLRQKALKEKITLEELAWVLLSYNQKRGYEKLEVENSKDSSEFIENLDLKVVSSIEQMDDEGNKYYEVKLSGNDGFTYKEYSSNQMSYVGDLKEVQKISDVDAFGNINPAETKFEVNDIYSLSISDVKYEKIEKRFPHKYSIYFSNGWGYETTKKKYTSQFFNLKGEKFDYIVTTKYDAKGELITQRGEARKYKEPNYDSDSSDDWTLLKKKTEKEALEFNQKNNYVERETGSVKKYISPFIYDVLKNDAKTGKRTKIIGGLFQVVERDFYREEVNQILKVQVKFHHRLQDKKIFEDCVQLLYPKNKTHAKTLLKNKGAIQNLLVEDILLYQRPLKTKKSEIANCKYEIRHWQDKIDKSTGEVIKVPYYRKAVPASHPLFQEFRIWDKIHNIRLIKLEDESDGVIQTNVDVTKNYFNSPQEYQELFQVMNGRKYLNQHQFKKYCKKRFGIGNIDNFVWNFPEDEELKGNETRISFAERFIRCGFGKYKTFLTQEKEIELWHYLYSVNFKDRTRNKNASLRTFFNNYFEGYVVEPSIKEKIIIDFATYPKFPSKYAAYSEKALNKLLLFMRIDHISPGIEEDDELIKELGTIKFDKNRIDSYLKFNAANLKRLSKNERRELEAKKQKLHQAIWQYSINKRIDEILIRLKNIDFSAEEIDYTAAVDVKAPLPFTKGLFNAFRTAESYTDFQNLNLTKASYLIYGRHSELSHAKYWKSPDQIREELYKELKQHSLNNPVAEKVIREMMQIVADIWDYYGDGANGYFSKIHLEVGRELKKSAKEKEAISNRQGGNRIQNKRIRQVLEEFLSASPYNAQFQNPDHFERLKIVENGAQHAKNTNSEFFNSEKFEKEGVDKKAVDEILKKPYVAREDFEKYKLWIEQGYRSPYTGEIISFSDLFNGYKYNVDHILPRASVTNNSLSNKVVCEFEVNKDKGDNTGRGYITANPGKKLYVSALDREITLLTDDDYQTLVKQQFSGTKRFILLAKEVPDGFTNSQLNSTKYIARKAMELLSHIVREEGEVEYRSRNVLPVTGIITNTLKKEWKLNHVWSELVAPRFKRLNRLTQSNLFGEERTSLKTGKEYFYCNLHETILEKNPDFNIKRIDHRHHALDALVVALCTDNHVNYLNNINAGINTKNRKQKIAAIKRQRAGTKRQIMFSELAPTKAEPKKKKWSFLLPGEYRKSGTQGSGQKSVAKFKYQYKDKMAPSYLYIDT